MKPYSQPKVQVGLYEFKASAQIYLREGMGTPHCDSLESHVFISHYLG